MRKILLVAFLVLLPLSVYALEPMSMDSLDEITAQEGVRITIGGAEEANALVITQTAADMAWENVGELDGSTENHRFSILMDVDEAVSNGNKISIWGDLKIQATQKGVELTLPSIVSENMGTKTTISLGMDLIMSDDGKLGYGPDPDPANGVYISGVLGTLYQGGGKTEITGNSQIFINPIH